MSRMGSHSYRGYSHEQLIAMLDAAKPEVVQDTYATRWQQVAGAIADLAVALDATILHGDWSGPAAEEFKRRLTATATCARDAGTTTGDVASGLGYLANDIAAAQRKMPDHPGTTPLSANTGAEDVVGSSGGYVNSLHAQKKAADQAEQVMTDLGGQMHDTATYWFPESMPAKPADLPSTPGGHGVILHTSHAGPGVSGVPGTRDVSATNTPGPPGTPVHPVRVDMPPTAPGTDLAGSGAPLSVPGAPSGAAGLVGGVPVGQVGAGTAQPPLAGGLAAGRPLTQPALSGPAGEQPAARSGGPLLGRSSGRRADDPDEYSTWLTEDDMVWRDTSEAPPSIIE
ncbi:MAG TPA: hypothetical protein VGN37_20530 [Actinocatenispora sp.]